MAEAASVAQPAAARLRKVLAQGVRGGAHVEWLAAAQAEPPVERLEDSKQPRLAPLTPLSLARQRWQRSKRVKPLCCRVSSKDLRKSGFETL